jgi:hypothetical protein
MFVETVRASGMALVALMFTPGSPGAQPTVELREPPSHAGDLYVWSPGGTLMATGPELSPSGYAAIDVAVADIDQWYPGFKGEFDQWKAGGGKVGLLTGGFAKDKGAGAFSGPDMILVDAHGTPKDSPTPGQVRNRLLHEFLHQLYGSNGFLDPCWHAGAYFYSFLYLQNECGEGDPSPCKAFDNLRAKYDEFAAECAASGGTVQPSTATGGPPANNPSCCK